LTYKHLNSCPICKSKKISFLLLGTDRLHKTHGEWPLWQCETCQVGFLNPMPTPDIIGGFYPQNYYAYSPPAQPKEPRSWLKKIAWQWRARRQQAYLAQRGYPNVMTPHLFYQLLAKVFPVKCQLPSYVPSGSFLDVGCGAGHYLLEMQQVGWDATGVELSPDACLAAKKAGLTVYQGHLEDMEFSNNAFDIVRMSDVFEHLPYPHQTLKEISRILKSNGQIEITLPNLNAWTFKLFHEYWFPLEIPRHLFHHTPKSIELLVKQHGLQIKELNIWSHKEVDIIPSLQWLLQERLPLLYQLLNYKLVWKIIRKCFAIPKAIASIKGQGSAMTITLIKSKESHD